MKRSIILILVLSLVTLTGCATGTKLSELEVDIYKNNKHVEFILEQQSKNKSAASGVESTLLLNLQGESINYDYSVILAESPIVGIMQDIQNLIKQKVYDEIEKKLESLQMEKSFESGDGAYTVTIAEEQQLEDDVKSSIYGGLRVMYFQDTNTGVTEQIILVPWDLGNHIVIKLFWLDGKCYNIDYEITGGN